MLVEKTPSKFSLAETDHPEKRNRKHHPQLVQAKHYFIILIQTQYSALFSVKEAAPYPGRRR